MSMNAIVILILAITMLGLGLTFMRGLFKQATEKLTEAVTAKELVNPPTEDNPLTTAPGELTLRLNKESGKIIVAYMNSLSSDDDCGLSVGTAVGTGIATAQLSYYPSDVAMKPEQINTWTIGVDPTADGTVIFPITMACTNHDYRKDIVITVTS